MDKLRIPSQIHHHDWVTYRFGLFTGACIILILYLAGNSPNIVGSGINNALIANVFRGLGIPILFAWTFAFVTIIWDLFGVNYVCNCLPFTQKFPYFLCAGIYFRMGPSNVS